MKNISLIAASVLALGWTAARADTTTSSPEPTSPPPAGTSININPSTTAPGTGVDVNTPPGANVDVNVNPPPLVDAPPPVAPDANAAGMNGAAIEPAPVVPIEPVAPVADRAPVERSWGSRVGGGLLVGGGFQDFTNDGLRNMTGNGGYWSARVVAGTRQYVGLEAAYVGDARAIQALGLASDARLISNGVEGALRLNIPVVAGASLVEPFGFVGLGWSHYAVTNTNINSSDVAGKDDIMTLPVGAGLAIGSGPFLADARFTYRQTYYNNLVPGGNLNNWGVGAQVGVGF